MGDSTRSGELPRLTLSAHRPRPDVCVVQVAGEVDMATAPEFDRYLREQTAPLPAHLVLDLAAVRLLAAAGIGVIVGALRNGAGGRLHLVGVAGNHPVERVLAITGTTALLDVRDSLEDLLAQLDRP